jgi:integrase
MLKDARRTALVKSNLFDRDLFDPLPQTDTEDSIDLYTPEERELIIEGFRLKRPQFFAFVYHQFWTGCRPSETCYLPRRHVDLRYGWERIEGSRVERSEDGTKTVRSNRQIQLSGHPVDVLSDHISFNVSAEWIKGAAADPDDYVFMYSEGRTDRREQFLQTGMAPDAPPAEDPPAAVLQHAPHLRELHALIRTHGHVCFSTDRRLDKDPREKLR